jgi:hypothetical protein
MKKLYIVYLTEDLFTPYIYYITRTSESKGFKVETLKPPIGIEGSSIDTWFINNIASNIQQGDKIICDKAFLRSLTLAKEKFYDLFLVNGDCIIFDDLISRLVFKYLSDRENKNIRDYDKSVKFELILCDLIHRLNKTFEKAIIFMDNISNHVFFKETELNRKLSVSEERDLDSHIGDFIFDNLREIFARKEIYDNVSLVLSKNVFRGSIFYAEKYFTSPKTVVIMDRDLNLIEWVKQYPCSAIILPFEETISLYPEKKNTILTCLVDHVDMEKLLASELSKTDIL